VEGLRYGQVWSGFLKKIMRAMMIRALVGGTAALHL
jgi:hypothetical protein